MKKNWRIYRMIGLVLIVLMVGIASYTGLNGMGLHRLTDRDAKGTVHFWYTNENMTNYYNNIASVYNQTNRGADVVPKLVSASEYIEQIYKASIEGQDYPDVYVITSDNVEKAYLSGLTLPSELKGFVGICINDIVVGWGKGSDHIIKNMYFKMLFFMHLM